MSNFPFSKSSLRCGAVLLALQLSAPTISQVHYHPDGRPWTQGADRGPDKDMDGWYYNLGISGIRVQLIADSPKQLLVKGILKDSPAEGLVRVGDRITGAGGRPFVVEHRNGYGMDVFGGAGPMQEFAAALEKSQKKSKRNKGRLEVKLIRGKESLKVKLPLGMRYGVFSKTFPADCSKSELVRRDVYSYLIENQRKDGSWGSPVHDVHAPLALLASGDRKHLAAVEKNVRMHARTTSAEDDSWLINWRYTGAAIVMGEYYLATKEKWVLPELQEVYDFLMSTQYMDISQLAKESKDTHPGSQPKGPLDSHGGWGHNPGFEGYGPISMITGQGALALAIMSHCGIEVDRERHDAAYAFLARGTGKNGYLWYKDEVAGNQNWADMGRTGAAGLANFLSPYSDRVYASRARSHAGVIGMHPETFPDTHASPIMGMVYGALAANVRPKSFRTLMDANRWWFVLSQCPDGSFYYQPNRDNSGYGADSRLSATAMTALIFSIPMKSLHLTGKAFD